MGRSVTTGPRVLLALPQMPHDPASGAARTASTICEFLAAAGFQVRGIGTTFTEGATDLSPLEVLESAGMRVRPLTRARGTQLARYSHRGVDYVLVDVDGRDGLARSSERDADFDTVFDCELRRLRPQVVITYGASPADIRRRLRARTAGAQVVFALFNTGYLESGLGPHVDLVLTPSRFLAELYRARCNVDSTPLPTPLQLDDVICPSRIPARITAVNPGIDKGAMILARIAHTLGTDYPTIPLELIESRSRGRLLVQAGFAAGFDLRRHRNLLIRPMEARPRDLYRHTRVLLVPSVCEEASARVVAEALVNAIPVVASNRGGLPENCGAGGFVLPLPRELTLSTRRPVGPEPVQAWTEALFSLFRDENAYQEASVRARRAGERYDPERVGPMYVELFELAAKRARTQKRAVARA